MASSVNKVILIGNLGKDPKISNLNSGDRVVSFTLATSDSWKDKNSGERKEKTEWHNIVMLRGLADVAAKFLQKGKLVYIEGKLRTRSFEDKEGIKKYTTEVVADNFTLLGRKADFENGSSSTKHSNKPDENNGGNVDLPDDINY